MAQPGAVGFYQTLYDFDQYFDGFCAIATVVLNSLSLLFHLKRSSKKSRFGMLFMLLVTFICFGLLYIPSTILRVLPWEERKVLFAKYSELIWLAGLPPYFAQQIVSSSGVFLALDRVLIMFLQLKYSAHNFSLILSVISCLINTVLLGFLFLVVVFAKYSSAIVSVHNALKFFLLSFTLVVEAVLYMVFLVKFRNHAKKSVSNDQQHNHTNQIVVCQTTCHLLLCTIPNAAICIATMIAAGQKNDVVSTRGIMFSEPMYSLSVLIASVFTLYKLKPKKDVVKVASTVASIENSPHGSEKCFFPVVF
ncbi:hypothetical protein QR680_012166 [Steinernema hermaphroditum]|uniref:Uncharacterized protein n=1 Tax=Steinernema hermaphroditum TaxID=289476 RepID=A0AA39LZE3_9BILA|nr:hypothetical protein QR680_012166 [Steinernema hermaphroditum]